MAMLVILLPARSRAAETPAATPVSADSPNSEWASEWASGWAAEPSEFSWLTTDDGLTISRQGRAALPQLPRADNVVVVVPAPELAWHRLSCPKAPANRLRAALGGVLEEHLLDDSDAVHLALAPDAVAGQPTWLAALHKPWLQAKLAALRARGLAVERVVPAWAPALTPGAEPALHFFTTDDIVEPASAWMAVSDAEQALCVPLAGAFAQELQARWLARGARPTATPAAAAMAERSLQPADGGVPMTVPLQSDAEQALAAVRTNWQLLQFDLAPSRRGTRALGNLLRQSMRPAWRPARIGLVALALVQLVGLNAQAWQQRRALGAQREAMDALLRSSFPTLRAVLDAPLQMKRETEALREAAGVPGEGDFETLLGAAAAAWPAGQPPAPQLRFEPGRLSLVAAGWSPPQVDQFRTRLLAGGWSLDQAEGRLNIQRAGASAR